MKYIELGIQLTDDLRLKSVTVNHNNTDFESDSKLIQRLAFAILKSIHANKESTGVQDLLNELDIKTE